MLQVPEDIFIDASTGRCYPVPSSPFLGVESMWNDTNYWVCMQMPEPHSDSRATPQQLSLDFADSLKWEYLLPTATPQVRNLSFACWQTVSRGSHVEGMPFAVSYQAIIAWHGLGSCLNKRGMNKITHMAISHGQ